MHACQLLTSHSPDDLVRHVPDVFYGERLEIVFLEEIIGAEAKQFKGNTNVAVVVKPVQYVYTSTKEEQRYSRCKLGFLCGKFRKYFHM